MCALVTGVQTCALPISAMGIGNDMAMGAYDKMTQAGMIDQADRQGQLDADKAQWEGEDQRNWDLLNRYYSIIGGNQWGQSGTSSGTSKSTTRGNIFGSVAGSGTAAAGAFADRPPHPGLRQNGAFAEHGHRVESGKSESVRVDHGCRRAT